MLTLTHALLEIRRTTPALSAGSYRPSENAPQGCFVYLRQFGSQRRLVALNFSGREQMVKVGEFGTGQLIPSTHPGRDKPIDLTAFGLQGAEGCIIALADSME
jgi:alpha-glucosidase